MQNYWIQVFNSRALNETDLPKLMGALLEVNYPSLCSEYGLDPASIALTLSHLEVVSRPEGIAPFFLVKYQPGGGAPLVVYRWDTAGENGVRWLKQAKEWVKDSLVEAQLAHTREILAVSIRAAQLEDMGLLLAYEVARWAAEKGEGLVFGLDGAWYRLNRHRAFLPIEGPVQG